MMPGSKDDPEAVQAYLDDLPDAQRQALESLRDQIKAQVPDVQERISYGGVIIFATRLDLVGCAARKHKLSFFTMSPGLAKDMRPAIEATHNVSGATIHFSPENPLSPEILREILKRRIAEQTHTK